jgi:hypothetical protein
MRRAPWTVAKVKVDGVWLYELWSDALPLPVGRFPSFDAAMERACEKSSQGDSVTDGSLFRA